MNNKFSKYVHFLEVGGKHFAFNVKDSSAVALNSKLYRFLTDNRDNTALVGKTSPALYEALVKAEMIVPRDKDESKELIETFRRQESSPDYFGIIVNPTLDCNLRCWYCYESHSHGSMMNETTANAVKALIDDKLTQPELRRLSLSFFGGEPLIGWDKVVMPLLTYATERCREKNIRFSTGFTTNGVLLVSRKLDDLASLGLGGTNFQISFDGHRPFHDVSRVGENRRPTYDRILGNLIEAAKRGFSITMRFNYTPDTVDSFADIFSDLESLLPAEFKSNIKCNFQQVWQTTDNGADVKTKAMELARVFNDGGYATDTDVIFHRHVCYADCENSIVVNYNGDLYKCTAREFSPETREGLLTPDGKVEWNERFAKRMERKFADQACAVCDIMPICHSGCTQNKLEREITGLCPLGKSDEDKHHYLLEALTKKIFK